MKKFVVTFMHTQLSKAEVEISARSLQHAHEIAEDTDSGELDTVAIDGELHVESIVPGRLPKKKACTLAPTQLEHAAMQARAHVGDIIRSGGANEEDGRIYDVLNDALQSVGFKKTRVFGEIK